MEAIKILNAAVVLNELAVETSAYLMELFLILTLIQTNQYRQVFVLNLLLYYLLQL